MTEPANTAHDEDGPLVSLCRKGDTDAFETLVKRHQKKMLNIAFRMTGSYEDACEIVQDAFVAAYGNISRFEERSRFSTWLYTIVVNRTRNHLKKAETLAGRREVSLDDPVRSEEGGICLEPVSAAPSVLETLEQREAQARVRQCINGLDKEFKEVLVLRDMQGLGYEEISSMLGLAAGTVKSRLFRARESVKNCLKKLIGRP
ncbi:MAG: sigma-70 family RNA polymerase sigma factor [Nitrospiraceae bacterium]|nr:sigma-70 family RNA polymerase sigma factor [Nitrospiraceae bacterium]